MAAQVLVNWTYAFSDQTGFLLQRSIDSASTWTVDYRTEASAREYTDSDVVIGGTYWYHVAATNQWGTGFFSNTGSVYISGSGSFPLGIPSLFAKLPEAGFKICNWNSILPQLITSSCNVSLASEWSGTFNQMSTTIPGFPGDPSVIPLPVWYFTGSSIGGNSVSADEAPDWPNNDWQIFDDIVRLFWIWNESRWGLEIACAGVGGAAPPWWYGRGNDIDINNPTGSYVVDSMTGLSTSPEIIVIKGLSDDCSVSPPSGPITLTVNSSSLYSYLSWNYTDTDQNGFIIRRSSDGITYSSLVFLTDIPSSRSYDDYVGPVGSPTTYWYRVDAYNSEGTTSSNTASAAFKIPSIAVFASSSNSVLGTSIGQTIDDAFWDDSGEWGYNNPRNFYVFNDTLFNLTINSVQITGSGFAVSSPFTPSSPPVILSAGEPLTFTITDISRSLNISSPSTATMNVYFSEIDSPYTLYFTSLSR